MLAVGHVTKVGEYCCGGYSGFPLDCDEWCDVNIIQGLYKHILPESYSYILIIWNTEEWKHEFMMFFLLGDIVAALPMSSEKKTNGS